MFLKEVSEIGSCLLKDSGGHNLAGVGDKIKVVFALTKQTIAYPCLKVICLAALAALGIHRLLV